MHGMNRFIPILFWLAALYDSVLGILFFIVPQRMMVAAHVPADMHPGYLQFPAALLVVFALMFAAIALHPTANSNLIPYGILLKVSYCSVVFRYWAVDQVAPLWKPFAIADAAFLVLFSMAYLHLRRLRHEVH